MLPKFTYEVYTNKKSIEEEENSYVQKITIILLCCYKVQRSLVRALPSYFNCMYMLLILLSFFSL